MRDGIRFLPYMRCSFGERHYNGFMRTAKELSHILSWGGGLAFDASSLTTSQLQHIVKFAKPGSLIILRNLQSRPTAELQQIVSWCTGTVVFDLDK